MRRPIVAGNWKMHLTVREAGRLTRGVLRAVRAIRGVEVVLCPPFTALAAVARALRGSPVAAGAQHCHWELQGAWTGEISPGMVAEAGARYCIVGHSERRTLFGESNEVIARKVRAILAHRLIPILCVGETLAQRDAGQTMAVVAQQVRAGLGPVPADRAGGLVVAYEPVWAIGTGRHATPEQAQEVHAFIRGQVARRVSPAAAAALRIQYGGSVKPDNAAALISQPDVDGFLVGGASLDAGSFAAIVGAASRHNDKGARCTSSR